MGPPKWLDKLILLLIMKMTAGVFLSGGFISLQPSSSGINKEIEMTFEIYWNSCDETMFQSAAPTALTDDNGTCSVGCAGKYQIPMQYQCMNYSNGDLWSYGYQKKAHYFSEANEYAVFRQSTGSWIESLENQWVIETSLKLSSRNDSGLINSSPVMAAVPILQFQSGCKYKLHVPVSDPDGDLVKCRLAKFCECGGNCNDSPGFSLDGDSCTLYYDAVHGIGYKVFVLMVEDYPTWSDVPLSSATLQYVFHVYESSSACPTVPEFLPPTAESGSCKVIPLGSNYTDKIAIFSGGQGVHISKVHIDRPNNISVSSVNQGSQPSDFYVTISWQPEFKQQNDIREVCFTAVNSLGLLSERRCVKYMTGGTPPSVQPLDTLEVAKKFHPGKVQFLVKFDQLIQRPNASAKILFRDYSTDEILYQINSALSDEVNFDQQKEITISPNITFPERTKIYMELESGVVEGVVGCEPGNIQVSDKNLWTFITQDVMPPKIKQLHIPIRSNENVFFIWNVSERVQSNCILDSGEGTDCSSGRFEAHNLNEGSHLLFVEHTDLENNTLNITYEFYADRTSPNISFTQVPTRFSNKQQSEIYFTCDELDGYCIYYCDFQTTPASESNYSMCSGNSFSTPELANELEYIFSVYAIDSVNNTGNPFSYTWTVDLTPPHVIVSNTSVHCLTETTPNNTGYVYASDNIDTDLDIAHYDEENPCLIIRTWQVTDDAGNTVNVKQTITKLFNPSLSFLPQLLTSCSSASDEGFTLAETATVYNPCGRPIILQQYDELQPPPCPGIFNRTLLLNDTCTGLVNSAQQEIKLYDMCPVTLCGRNYSQPHGFCSRGTCYCNKPWHGDDCSILIYEPKIEPFETLTLLERQDFSLISLLTQGTLPVTWSLVSAPMRTTIDYVNGYIQLRRAPAGNHTIIVSAENEVGKDTAMYNLIVKATYKVFLNAISDEVFPYAKPMILTGYVVHDSESPVYRLLNGSVPLVVDVYNPSMEINRTINGRTDVNSNFAVKFSPSAFEYGIYEASSRHPSETPGAAELNWKVHGMRTLHRSVLLSGDTAGPYHNVYMNVTLLKNDGPEDLHLVKALPVKDDVSKYGISVNLTIDGKSIVPVLTSGREMEINIEIETNGALQGSFPVYLEAKNGTSTVLTVNLDVKQMRPMLQFVPSMIDGIVARGKQKVFGFNITNSGKLSTDNVTVILDSSLFTLASFGVGSLYGNGLTLGKEETASGSLLVLVPEDHPLGTLSGTILAQSKDTFAEIPYIILISSDNSVNLTIIVEDEYTYFADGNPLVANADVRLMNHRRGIDLSRSTSANNGTVTFENIPEDRYEVYLEAPGHNNMEDMILVSLEKSSITLFFERRAVNVELIVTPVEFEDKYIITLEADFEVNIPMPVVTVSPNNVDLEVYKQGLLDVIEFNVTNHGLIRADNVQIELPMSHPSLEFTSLVDIPFSLEAKSSAIIPVRITKKHRKKRILPQIFLAMYIGSIVHSFVCSGEQWRRTVILFNEVIEVIEHGPSQPCVPPPVIATSSGEGGPIYRGKISSPIFSVLSTVAKIFCDPCVGAVLGCAPSPGFKFASLIPLIAELPETLFDALSWYNAGLGEIIDFIPDLKDEPDLSKALDEYMDKLGRFLCFAELIDKCVYRGYKYITSNRKKRSNKDIAILYAETFFPMTLSVLYAAHIFGDKKWLSLNDSEWITGTFRPVFDDNSELGLFVSLNESQSIRSGGKPENINDEDVQLLIERFNTTFTSWQQGVLNPTNSDDNIISYTFLEGILYNISQYNARAKDKGFESYIDAFKYASSALDNIDTAEGVCAVVKIQIKQAATLTREGFSAKLKIENQEMGDLNKLHVHIEIYDGVTRDNSTDLFSIGKLKLSGSLTGVDGYGTLTKESSGTAEWLIIPYSQAAPTVPKAYKVGGRLSYQLDDTDIDMPLQPAKITVYPDPSLMVHYFWEKNVISDDPFTEEIEPAIPFSLGVMIKNKGFGIASNMKIKSAQPEIIENEKGLLMNFQIIGAVLGSDPMNPSLEVNFGDIHPKTTQTARWKMICSLMGEFKGYNASFENVNPLGDAKLSVLDELKIHELISNVRIFGLDDDGILDFLVSDKFDIQSTPDRIYSSKDLSSHPVMEGNVTDFDSIFSDELVTMEVKANSVENGWVYFSVKDQRLNDLPFGKSSKLARQEGNRKRSLDAVDLPNDNAWISVEVLNKNRVRSLNIVDFVNTSLTDFHYFIEFTKEQMTSRENMSSITEITKAEQENISKFTSPIHDDTYNETGEFSKVTNQTTDGKETTTVDLAATSKGKDKSTNKQDFSPESTYSHTSGETLSRPHETTENEHVPITDSSTNYKTTTPSVSLDQSTDMSLAKEGSPSWPMVTQDFSATEEINQLPSTVPNTNKKILQPGILKSHLKIHFHQMVKGI